MCCLHMLVKLEAWLFNEKKKCQGKQSIVILSAHMLTSYCLNQVFDGEKAGGRQLMG